MKVLLLGWEYPPHISGGLGTACAGIARGLAAQGAQVLVLVPQAIQSRSEGALELRGTGTRTGTAVPGAYSGAAYGAGLFEAVAHFAQAVREEARSSAHDVIHAHDWMSVPAGIAAREASGKPLVWHVHSCEADRAPGRPDARIAALEQLGLDAAERVVAVSHFTAARLRREYRVDASKLRVVHNGVEPRERPAALARPVPEPIVLFLGRITFQKGPEYFLEAAARVVRAEPRVKFVMSGSGDLLPRVVERSAELGLARHVHFTGFLDGAEVERMLALADVYVMPSVSEPFGLAPLEALSLDTPVIVSRQSGVREVLKSAPSVDHWDVQGLSERILELLRSPARRRSLAARGRRELARLRWESAGARLARVFAELGA